MSKGSDKDALESLGGMDFFLNPMLKERYKEAKERLMGTDMITTYKLGWAVGFINQDNEDVSEIPLTHRWRALDRPCLRDKHGLGALLSLVPEIEKIACGGKPDEARDRMDGIAQAGLRRILDWLEDPRHEERDIFDFLYQEIQRQEEGV
ncbi:MAG: hypothetical protein QF682_01820 [Candidatus Thermoplasmatota archaeon]|jgi:hypothetical protein|nr:hypothetical protein [Candidatus Thermoplasmatota archaeon]